MVVYLNIDGIMLNATFIIAFLYLLKYARKTKENIFSLAGLSGVSNGVIGIIFSMLTFSNLLVLDSTSLLTTSSILSFIFNVIIGICFIISGFKNPDNYKQIGYSGYFLAGLSVLELILNYSATSLGGFIYLLNLLFFFISIIPLLLIWRNGQDLNEGAFVNLSLLLFAYKIGSFFLLMIDTLLGSPISLLTFIYITILAIRLNSNRKNYGDIIPIDSTISIPQTPGKSSKDRKVFKWLRAKKFWDQYIDDIKEIGPQTFVIFCKNLSFKSFRLHFDFDPTKIYIDTLLPLQYFPNVGFGRIKSKWYFGPFEEPAITSDNLINGIIAENIKNNNVDRISHYLNSNVNLNNQIKRILRPRRELEMLVPIKIINDEKGLNVRFTILLKNQTATSLVSILLNEVVNSIHTFNLPRITHLEDSIDNLIEVYSSWETTGYGKKISQPQMAPPTTMPTEKVCPNCGKKMYIDAKFCSDCAYTFNN